MNKLVKQLAFAGALAFASASQAGMIGFEDYIKNDDRHRKNATDVGFDTGDNNVSFFAKNRLGVSKKVFVVREGYPADAYVPGDEIPSGPNYDGGHFFLTEDKNGPSTRFDYFMNFEKGISDLSLAVYDYGAYGGPTANDPLTLFLYDIDWNEVGSYTTTPGGNPSDIPDPNLILLSASTDSVAYHAAVIFSKGDVGTGIDNVRFTTVPEPGSVALLALGLVGLSFARRRA